MKTIQDFNTVKGSCNGGSQNPVIFDANGSLLHALGLDPLVIGFSSTCALDTQAGHIKSAMILLNGSFQDGVTNATSNNFELSADQFDEAITHEMGHFSGLGHSQVNLDLFRNGQVNNCDVDELAGLPSESAAETAGDRICVGPNQRDWCSEFCRRTPFSREGCHF